jgi:DNA repair protein RadC
MSVDSSLGSSNGGRPLSPVRKYGIPRYRVTLVREGRAIPAAESVHTSEGAAAILRPLFAGLDREQFLICGLDAKHKLIGINVVSTGSLNLTIVHPREVFKPLILMNAGAWLTKDHPVERMDQNGLCRRAVCADHRSHLLQERMNVLP